VTIATLTADAAQALKRNQMLSANGYRVITPKTPDGIVPLLVNECASAVIFNNSVSEEQKAALVPEIRKHCPHVFVLHVYHRGGERHIADWADANVDVTDPARLIIALEDLLRSRIAPTASDSLRLRDSGS
jgi:hypothetical protein